MSPLPLDLDPQKKKVPSIPTFLDCCLQLKDSLLKETKEEVSVKPSSRPVNIPPLHYIRCFFSYYIL
jgi:hypothetical protein